MIASRTVRGLNLIVSDPRVLSLSVPVHKEQSARVVVDGSDQSVLQPASPSPEPTKIRPSDFGLRSDDRVTAQHISFGPRRPCE